MAIFRTHLASLPFFYFQSSLCCPRKWQTCFVKYCSTCVVLFYFMISYRVIICNLCFIYLHRRRPSLFSGKMNFPVIILQDCHHSLSRRLGAWCSTRLAFCFIIYISFVMCVYLTPGVIVSIGPFSCFILLYLCSVSSNRIYYNHWPTPTIDHLTQSLHFEYILVFQNQY